MKQLRAFYVTGQSAEAKAFAAVLQWRSSLPVIYFTEEVIRAGESRLAVDWLKEETFFVPLSVQPLTAMRPQLGWIDDGHVLSLNVGPQVRKGIPPLDYCLSLPWKVVEKSAGSLKVVLADPIEPRFLRPSWLVSQLKTYGFDFKPVQTARHEPSRWKPWTAILSKT